MFMNDRLTGNGLYNKSKQRARREYGWKPRSYKGWDGKWHSYDGLGAISDWIALTADIMDNGLDFGLSGKGVLRPNDVGENLRAMGFVVGATLTDKSFLSGIEPMMDVLRGDPGAINRWSSSFISSATLPGASYYLKEPLLLKLLIWLRNLLNYYSLMLNKYEILVVLLKLRMQN